jgi:hypothetical protein
MTNHQRKGSISNAHAGREFEDVAQRYFAEQHGYTLTPNFAIELGVAGAAKPKSHRFDLGCNDKNILVECKSHNWTETGNMPSAKLTVWNEAMFYFLLAPAGFKKYMFVLKSKHPKQGNKTLAEYYVEKHGHLVPPDVTIIEYDMATNIGYVVLAAMT